MIRNVRTLLFYDQIGREKRSGFPLDVANMSGFSIGLFCLGLYGVRSNQACFCSCAF